MAPSILIVGILSIALWLPSRGSVAIAIFAALYGLFAGEANKPVPRPYLRAKWSFHRCGYLATAFLHCYHLPDWQVRSKTRSVDPSSAPPPPSSFVQLLRLRSLKPRIGSIFTVAAVATLAGTPTAGAFLKEIDQSHLDSLIIFTGVLVLVGAIFFVLTRIVHSRRAWAKIWRPMLNSWTKMIFPTLWHCLL